MDPPSLPPFSSSSVLPISPNPVDSTTPPISTSSYYPAFYNHPLPSLPTELKREVLRFCDPSTLANTSLVSLAFLELSGPLLYHDVTIRGWEQLVKLFWVRKRQQPQIDDYLSLEQIQHLTYIYHPSQEESPPLFRPSPLRISSLTIDLIGNHDVGDPPSSSLVHLFDPLTLNLRGPIPEAPDQLPRFSLTPLVRWTRLQTLTLRNAQLSDVVGSRWFSSLVGPLTIEMNLSDAVIGLDSAEGSRLWRELKGIALVALASQMAVDASIDWLGVVKVLFGWKGEIEPVRARISQLKELWKASRGCRDHPEVVEGTLGQIQLLSISSSTQPRT